MLGRLDRLAYRGWHASWLLHASLLQGAARLLTRTPRPPLDARTIDHLRRRHAALHARDLANVDAGLYPRALLFDQPLGQYLRALPRLVRDAPRVARRRRAGAYRDLPPGQADRYPHYYRRTFHWQTDGYLSEHSAEVYDLGVELLFRGTADVMRRQIVPPISRWLAARPAGQPPARVLDVACGTGAALRQVIGAHPDLSYIGLDLSAPYLAAARRRLGARDLTLVEGNAEALPFPDGSVDLVTCVYLFHELPRNARRRVARELRRVLAPDGLLVVEDSAQLAEAAELAPALRNFPREFHEPFYEDYLGDDLAPLLAEAGFAVDAVEPHLVAKVVVATPR